MILEIQRQRYEAQDVLLAEVRNAVFSGRPVPDHPSGTNPSSLAAIEGPAPSRTLDYTRRQLGRSKRKVVATLSGVAVGGVVTGLVTAAVLATPVGWAIGGAMATAAAAALAGYVATRCIRNARAWYYERTALPAFAAQTMIASGRVSSEVANGVRYWLQKRKISAIADDVRDLNHALTEYEKAKYFLPKNCAECVHLAKSLQELNLCATKLKGDLELFTKFHNWIKEELETIFRGTSGTAFTDARIARVLISAFQDLFLPRFGIGHIRCDAKILACPLCCYRLDEDGKAVNPMVRTAQTLSSEMRSPFVRMTNDAAYIAQHGESLAVASYHDSQDYIQKLLPPLSAQTYLDLREQSNRAAAPPASSSQAPAAADYGAAMQKAAVVASIRGTASTSASLGVHVAAADVGLALSGTLVSAGLGGAASLGVGLVKSVASAAAEAANTNLEFRVLHETMARRDTPADFDRMVIALRTIMKDAHYFEKCVDELSKLITYHQEFSAVCENNSAGPNACGFHFERIYRCFKACKHTRALNQYYPYVKMFAAVAEGILAKTSEDRLETEQAIVRSRIGTVIDSIDHEKTCRPGSYCYGGRLD